MTTRLDAANAVIRCTGLPSGWSESELGSLVRVIGGGTPDREESAYWRDGGIPWITPTDLTANAAKYIEHGAEHISEAGLENSNATLVPVGSIVFSTRGTVGNIAIARVPLTTNQSCEVLAPIAGTVNSDFLYYLLTFGLFAFHRLACGTTFGSITRRDIARVKFALPTPDEQSAIACVLNAVDKTIEQARASIDAARSVAASLAGHLLECGVESNGEVRLKDSSSQDFYVTDLGLLPKAWHVMRLVDIAEVERGRFSPRPRNDPRFYGGPFPFVQTGQIAKAKGRVITTFVQTLNAMGKAVSKEFPKDTIIITIAANIGETAILGVPMCVPDSLVGVTVNEDQFPRFIELCLRRLKPKLSAMAPRSAQANINLTTLKPLRLPIPPLAEQKQIAALVDAAEARVIALEAKQNALQNLKKSLLHDLLTGTVRLDPALFAETPT